MPPDETRSPDAIELVTPAGREWEPVIRLVLGGVADRLNLGFEELDDLQLAVERLIAEAGAPEEVRLSFEVTPRGVRTRVGPLRESVVTQVLRGPEPLPGELNLRRILETVVDSFRVERLDGDDIVVTLEKAVGG